MLNRKADTIEVLSYRELGNLALRLARNNRRGLEGSKRQTALWGKASTVRHLLKALETRERMDYKVANKLLSCLVKIADINDFPAAPVLLQGTKPTIILKVGEKGDTGIQGPPGSDATIDVLSGDDNIQVSESAPGGVRTFTLSYGPYTAPDSSISIDTAALPLYQSLYRETGESVQVNFNIVITKGRNDVQTSTISSHPGLDTVYQGLFDANTVNTNGSQTITGLNATAVVATTTYQVDVTDDKPTTVTDSASIYFNYPILQGSNSNLVATYYSLLTKVTRSDAGIQPKQTTVVNFNSGGALHYFYFAFPDSYGVLNSIKDANGFEVFRVDQPAFLETTGVSVTSSGLANNWSQPYTVYRTVNRTIINNAKYTFSWQ